MSDKDKEGIIDKAAAVCPYCKNRVSKQKAECKQCEKIWHISCAKRKCKLSDLEVENFVCCEINVCSEEDYLREENRLLRGIILDKDTIVKDKEVIIQHLMEKIDWLNNKLNHLESSVSISSVSREDNVKKSSPVICSGVEKNFSNSIKGKDTAVFCKPPELKNANAELAKKQDYKLITLESVQKGIQEAQNKSAGKHVDGSLPKGENVSCESEWEVVKRKKTYKRQSRIVGTGNGKTFEVAPKYKHIFATGFAVGTTETSIVDYLKQLRDGNYLCEKLQTRNDQTVTSFKISVPFYMKEEVLNPDLWPCGIIVDNFFGRLVGKKSSVI